MTFAVWLRSRFPTEQSASALRRLMSAAGCPVATVTAWSWLAGQRRPSATHLEVLLDALEVTGAARDIAYRLHREAGMRGRQA